MKKIIVLLALAGIVLSGCSTKVLLPYEENPVCSRGKEGGYCGSLSDVYKQIEKQEEENWLKDY